MAEHTEHIEAFIKQLQEIIQDRQIDIKDLDHMCKEAARLDTLKPKEKKAEQTAYQARTQFFMNNC